LRRHPLQLALYPLDIGCLAQRLEDLAGALEITAGLLVLAQLILEQPVFDIDARRDRGGTLERPAQLDRLLEEDEPRVVYLLPPQLSHERIALHEASCQVLGTRDFLRAPPLRLGLDEPAG